MAARDSESGPTRRSAGRRWPRYAIAVAVLGLAGVLLFVVVELLRIPTLADAPELAAVDLSALEAAARSDSLAHLLDDPARATSASERELLEEASRSLDEGRWLASPERVRSGLAVRHGFARSLVDAMRAPGCLEEPTEVQTGVLSSGLAIRDAARTIASVAVARAQLGEEREGAEELVAFLESLVALQTRCPHGLVLSRLLQESVDWLHKGAGYLLAAPDVPASAQRDLGRLLVALDTQPVALSNVVRREWALWQARLASWPAAAGEHAELDEARAMTRRAFSRLLWLAEQPEGAQALYLPTPEEVYVDRLADSPHWLLPLRLGKGTVVGLMMGAAELAVLRPQLGRFRMTRCAWAVRRARWVHALDRAGRSAAASLRAPTPRNPVTGRAIVPGDSETAICAPSSEGRGEEILDDAIELPGPPPRAADPHDGADEGPG